MANISISPFLKIIIFTIADAVLSGTALVLAFLLRFEGTIPPEYQARILYFALIFALLNLFFLHRDRLYSFTWSFVSLAELNRLLRALSYASVVFALVIFLDLETFSFFTGFPRSVIVLSYILGLVFIGGLRIAKRIWFETLLGRSHTTGEPTLIVGAGRPGEHLIRNLKRIASGPHQIIGIVDEKLKNQGVSIHSVPVLGYIRDIPRLVEEHHIKHLVIALEREEAKAIQEAVEAARNVGITSIKIVPEFSELLGQALSFRALKEITVEDLLGREPTKIDTEAINDFIRDKTILVSGASGSIGSELCRQILRFSPRKLIALDLDESGLFDLEHELHRLFPKAEVQTMIANVTDREKMNYLVSSLKPDIIFHAAAYKHVHLMEEHPDEAVRTNIFGTLYLAQAAKNHGVHKFVLVSTDKAVMPISVYGKTKRIAEMVVKGLNEDEATKFVAVRFGNVLGSRGSVIPLFQEQIRRGGPVTVTHPDMIRYFMTIPEATLLVMGAGAIGEGGETFILDMGKPIKIIELAKELIRLSGYEPDIHIPIAITGIRPGENLAEEILTEEEKKQGATKWEKIYISKTENNLDFKTIADKLADLEKPFAGPAEGLRKKLDELLN